MDPAMRFVLASLVLVAALLPAPPSRAQFCSDDYVTIDTIVGTILEIQSAPEPFKSADIFLSGPERCARMWMQVLKRDAEQCRVGDRVEASGVVTSDPAENSWQINPERNEYMLLGQDFTCSR
jgi:hypothetical protein